MRTCDMGVDRRCGDPLVSEQLLHGAEIAAALDEVRRERVTQRVRPHPLRQAERLGVAAHDQEHPAPRQPAPAIVDEQRIGVLARAEMRAAAREVPLDGAHGLAAARHDALAAALAEDAHQPELGVEVTRTQAAQLRDPQAGAVEELEDRAVAQAERRGVRMLDQRDRLLGREGMRRRLRGLRQRDVAHAAAACALARPVPEQRARGGQPATHGRRR